MAPVEIDSAPRFFFVQPAFRFAAVRLRKSPITFATCGNNVPVSFRDGGVNGIRLYHEIYGAGEPLVLLTKPEGGQTAAASKAGNLD